MDICDKFQHQVESEPLVLTCCSTGWPLQLFLVQLPVVHSLQRVSKDNSRVHLSHYIARTRLDYSL
jgi:hypothetical protein